MSDKNTGFFQQLGGSDRRRFVGRGLGSLAAIVTGALTGRQALAAEQQASGTDPLAHVRDDPTAWTLEGDWFDVCSCNLPCPCEFAQPPTDGHCEGVLPYQISRGRYGDVKLDGLNVVLITGSRGHLWERQGKRERGVGIFIDAHADSTQQAALETIFTGSAGGWPETFSKGFTRLLGVESAPIEIHIEPDLAAWSVRVGDVVEANAVALDGPTTPPGTRVQLYNPPGSEVGPGHVATWGRGLHQRTQAFGFDLELENVSSKHIPFTWWGQVVAA